MPTYSVGEQPTVQLRNIYGDVKISGWDQSSVEITGDADVWQNNVTQHGDAITMDNINDDLSVRVPRNAQIQIDTVKGDVTARDLQTIQLIHVSGDVALRNIGGTAELGDIDGDLLIEECGSISCRHSVSGDVRLEHAATVSFEVISGDLHIYDVTAVHLGHVDGDLKIREAPEGCHMGHIGGDAALHNTGPVTAGNIAGDLAVNRVPELRAGSISGDCAINGEGCTVALGNVRGDLAVRLQTGSLQAGDVHGDAAIDGVDNGLTLGTVHGDLALRLKPANERSYRLNVRGDAALTLPPESNIAISAVVRGRIVGLGSVRHGEHGGAINVTFGSGNAQLQLTVGGDLAVQGPSHATSSSWGPDLGMLNEELGHLGRELGDIGREIAASFGPDMWGARRGRKHGRSRIPGLDPDQKEAIKRQVREAADQARRSVQQALREAGIASPPAPPRPQTRATPPAPPEPIRPDEEIHDPDARPEAVTGATVRLSPLEEAAQLDTDAERLAILRMLQEGKISPEEAEDLLSKLDR